MVGNGAQIIGKVNPDLSVKVLNAQDLGNNVGMYFEYTYLTYLKPVQPSDLRC